MTATKWTGPYTHSETASRARLEWDPIDGAARPPTDSVRFVVRWRVSTSTNPRKRTFTDVDAATRWAKHIAVAKLLHSPADDRGRPRDADYGAAQPVDAAAANTTHHGSPTPIAMLPTQRPVDLRDARDADIAEFVVSLIEEHQPRWEEEHQARWWIDQLETFKACFTYGPDDDRIGRHGIRAGDSKRFHLLRRDDFTEALRMRRGTNLAAAHRNRQRKCKYERLRADYHAKLAAWNAREGYRGRKPTPPPAPAHEADFSDTEVLIGPATEIHFRMACSFVFDRAFDAGLFPPGPNIYRQWNPRASGGRATRSTPFRKKPRAVATQRSFPGAGFWIDLGDTIAGRGEILDPASRLSTGERFRILPLVAWQLALRPSELVRLRADHVSSDGRQVLVEPEDGYHLKARDPGVVRTVPLAAVVAAFIRAHADSCLGADDGTVFVAATGMSFDNANFYRNFMRPALAKLCEQGGLWRHYPALRPGKLYDFRKAGITMWLTQGADTAEAASWAGHTEDEQSKSYRGVINGAGRRATWTDMDTALEAALRADPPRGEGALAGHVRDWLHSTG